IGVAHADMAPTIEATIQRKGRLIAGLSPGGSVFLNCDTPGFGELSLMAKDAGASSIFSFGERPEADVALVEWSPTPMQSSVVASVFGETIEFKMQNPGKGAALSSVLALGVYKFLGFNATAGARTIEKHSTASHVTSQYELMKDDGSVLLIDDTKNAADLSMKAAFELLARLAGQGGGRGIAVVGKIVNLGDQAERIHRELAGPLMSEGITHVFTSGDGMSGMI